MKILRNKRKFLGIVSVIGMLIFLISGICFNKAINTRGRTVAKVTKVLNEHDIEVSYTVDGLKYETVIEDCKIAYNGGESLNIYYNKDYPKDIYNDEVFLKIFPISIVGIVILTTGAAGYGLCLDESNKKEELIDRGLRVYTTLVRIERMTNPIFNKIQRYRIVTKWRDPETKETIYFTSEKLYKDPRDIIKEKQIEYYEVYINIHNVYNYYMNVEDFLE